MRLSVVAASALALSVSASTILERQSTGDLPSCVTGCFTKVENGGCGLDFACLCRNNAFITSLAQCVYSECPAEVVQGAIDSATGLCTAQGVSVTVPEPSGGSAPSGSGSAGPSQTGNAPAPSGSGSGSAPSASGSGSGSPPAPSASGSAPPAPSASGNAASKNSLQVMTGVLAAGVVAALV